MNQIEFSQKYTLNSPNKIIGHGVHGKVYLAQDNDSAISVAIKDINIEAEKVNSNWPLGNIKQLINLPAFRNIVKYKNIDTLEEPTKNSRFIVMPYTSKGNLKDYTSNNQLSSTQKKEIASQLLEGLRFLHQYQIIHYHLKPTNVLVFIGNTGKVNIKISDYGMIDSDVIYDDLCVNYMSPEQWLGLPKDVNTDLWSFGLLIYELFTGKRCISVNSYFQQGKLIDSTALQEGVQKQIQETDFNLLPGHWGNVVYHCLTWDPALRPNDEFDIDMLLSGVTPIANKAIVPPPPVSPSSETAIPPAPSSDSANQMNSEEINATETLGSREKKSAPKIKKLYTWIGASVSSICLLAVCAFFMNKAHVSYSHRSSSPYVVANVQGPEIPRKILPRDLLYEYLENIAGSDSPFRGFLDNSIVIKKIEEHFGEKTYRHMCHLGGNIVASNKKTLGDTIQYATSNIDNNNRNGYIFFYKMYLSKSWMELYFMKENMITDALGHYLPEGAWVRSYKTNEYGEEDYYCPILKQSFQETNDDEDYFNIWIMSNQIIVYRATSGFLGGKRKFETLTFKNNETGKERTIHLIKFKDSTYTIRNQEDISFITESFESSNTTFIIHDHTFFLETPEVYEYNLAKGYTKCKAQMYDYLYHKNAFTDDED